MVIRWWKGVDAAKNFPYARDRLVESFVWNLEALFEPNYSFSINIHKSNICNILLM